MERVVPIKILGVSYDARVHMEGPDLVIDIPHDMLAHLEADNPGVGTRHGYRLAIERGRIVDLVQGSPPRKRKYVGACPECGAQAGLHALSCQYYQPTAGASEHLSDARLAQLRSLPPSQWQGWPPDEYDQGLPVVEIRQDHLEALLAEMNSWRGGE